jgi:hypothetical protein
VDGSKAIGGQDGKRAFLTSFVQPVELCVHSPKEIRRLSGGQTSEAFPPYCDTPAYYPDGALVQDQGGPEELFTGHEDSFFPKTMWEECERVPAGANSGIKHPSSLDQVGWVRLTCTQASNAAANEAEEYA